MYIRQISLISFEEIIKFQQENKLEMIFSQIDVSKLTTALRKTDKRRGPKGYEPSSLIYALIAMQVEKTQTIKDLVLSLKQNPILRYCCGFDVLGQVPSESTFSRFLNTLRATGGLNAAETSVQSELGIEDSKDKFYEDTMKGGHDKNIPELVKTLTQNAADAVEWLIDLGGDFTNVGRLGGASNDRAHRPEGGDPVGPEVVSTLRTVLEDKGMEVMTNTTATEVLSEDGVVTGVVAEDEEGNELTILADAVIISTGGFGANSEMQVEYNSELEGFGTTNHPGATGDGIKMALELGAGLTQIKEIQTHPTTLPNDGYMITEAVRGNGALLINRDGERFIDEIETRDVVSEAILSQENGTAFLFFNQEIADSLGAIDGYIKRGLTVEGETIEELAETLEIPADKITETVEKYNGFVAAGEDTDFNRADMPRSIEGGKYYAIQVTPSVHHTMGGLTINTDAQVLTEDGEVIEGLFAAGEVVGGVHGGNRLGGNALADIVVFGRIAGQNAAK